MNGGLFRQILDLERVVVRSVFCWERKTRVRPDGSVKIGAARLMRPQSENKERLFGSSEDGRRSARRSAVGSRKKIVEK